MDFSIRVSIESSSSSWELSIVPTSLYRSSTRLAKAILRFVLLLFGFYKKKERSKERVQEIAEDTDSKVKDLGLRRGCPEGRNINDFPMSRYSSIVSLHVLVSLYFLLG